MTLRYLVLSMALSFGASIASSHLHPYGNPWTTKVQTTASLLQDASMPAEARAVLVTKCADCHSEATHAPFYASFAPGSWLIERDIMKGRAHMNLSNWQKIAPERREVLEEEIVQQTSKGKMPPVQYRLLHWNARLSAQDVHALAMLQTSAEEPDGRTQRAMRRAERWSLRSGAPDVMRWMRTARGRSCEQFMDARRAALPDLSIPRASHALGLVWNPETLDRWLTDPDAMVAGNDMSFATPKAQDRKDLIAFLQQAAGGK